MKDFVIYGDTDSVYVNAHQFILDNINDKDKWINLSDDDKLEYIKKIAKEVENYVNDRVYNHLQKKIYNSTEEDFKITYEQEKIAKTGLWRSSKKRYATFTILNEGQRVDKISVTGFEIIRSDTPLIFKEALKVILEMILKNYTDEEIKKKYKEYIEKSKTLPPEEVSTNTTINKLGKYLLDDFKWKKGTPWHLKGVANYNKLLNILKIKEEYPEIHEGAKAHIIYVKSNPYGVDAITFQKWPEEFNKFGIQPDYDKMIDKYLTKKVDYLLEPMNKQHILDSKGENLNLFFG